MAFTPTNADTWKFKTQHVQEGGDVLNDNGSFENFISAESIILAAGPAKLNGKTLSDFTPIGLCDSIGLQSNKNIVQIFEIGGRLPYMLPGRTFVQLQLNRVVFNGDSLLGALSRGNNVIPSSSAIDAPGSVLADANSTREGKFYLSLASSFFNSPFGLAILFQDGDIGSDTGAGQYVDGYYAENCLVQSHQMNIQGQQYVVMESCLVRCGNLIPMTGLKASQ